MLRADGWLPTETMPCFARASVREEVEEEEEEEEDGENNIPSTRFMIERGAHAPSAKEKDRFRPPIAHFMLGPVKLHSANSRFDSGNKSP